MATEALEVAVSAKGVRQVVRSMESLGSAGAKVEKAFGLLKGAIIGIGAAKVVGLFKGMITDVANTADQFNKMAKQVGISSEALQQLEFAAKISGSDIAVLRTGLQRFARTVDDSVAGSKEAQESLERLGVSARDSQGNMRPLDDLLGDVAERFKNTEDGVEKTAIAMKVFGRSGALLIPLLNEGKDGIAELRQEFVDLGGQIDTETGKQFEDFNDTQTRLQTALQGIKNEIVIQLLPVLADAANHILEWVKANKDLIKVKIQEFIQGAIKVGKLFIEILAGIGRTAVWVADNVGSFTEIAKATFTVISPLFQVKRAFDFVSDAITGNREEILELREEAAWDDIYDTDAIDDFTRKMQNLGFEFDEALQRTRQLQDLGAFTRSTEDLKARIEARKELNRLNKQFAKDLRETNREEAKRRLEAAKDKGGIGGATNDTAARAAEQRIKRLNQIRGEVNGVVAANQKLAEVTEFLNDLERRKIITEEESNRLLAAKRGLLEANLDPFSVTLKSLKEETESLRAITEEQKLDLEINRLKKKLIAAGITPKEQQLQQIREELELQRQLRDEEEARQRAAREREAAEAEAARKRKEEAARQAAAQGTTVGTRVEITEDDSFSRLRGQLLSLDDIIENTLLQGVNNLSNAFAEMATGGEVDFKRMADSMVKNLLRVIAQQLILQGLSAVLPGGGPQVSTKLGGVGSILGGGQGLLGAQRGADFMVGGSGGTDSQVVAFRATPGEQVQVKTPQQQKQAAPTAEQRALKIVNVTNPREAINAMRGSEGEEVIFNAIGNNAAQIRRLLGFS